MKALNAHAFELAVDGFDASAIVIKVIFIDPSQWTHILARLGDQTHARVFQDAGGGLTVNVALIGKDPRARRQGNGQLMNGSEVMISRRQQFKRRWQPLWGTDQMQAPAEEFLVFSGTITTIVAPAHLSAATGTDSFAHGHRQTVCHKYLMTLKHTAQDHQYPRQPLSQWVQPPIEARDTQTLAQVSHPSQHEQRSLMVILKVHRRDDGNPQHLGITDFCQNVALMSKAFQTIVGHDIACYNSVFVHAVPHLCGLLGSYHFDLDSMNVN